MRTRDKHSARAFVTPLALPLLGALAGGCGPGAAPDVAARGEGLVAGAEAGEAAARAEAGEGREGGAAASAEVGEVGEGRGGGAAASAEAGCEPLKLYDARFRARAERRYEETHAFDPEGPSCEVSVRSEASAERYHLFWRDTQYYFARYGQESRALPLGASTSATEFTFAAQFDPFSGPELDDLCPEYSAFNGFGTTLTGTLQGRVDLATGELSFARRCLVENGFSCDGIAELELSETVEGAHACEPSNADPLPVACAPLAADDLDAARLHVIGTRLDMNDVLDVQCSVAYQYHDFDATFTLREEAGAYFANLFALGRPNSIALTKTSETAAEVVFKAQESGQLDNYVLLNICPEYYPILPYIGPNLAGSLELRVDRASGAVSTRRYCTLDFPTCGNDLAFIENGEGAVACPPP